MSATDVGCVPPGGVKDNKEETMRLPGRRGHSNSSKRLLQS